MYIAGLSSFIWGIFLYIDGVIYNSVRWIYDIFLAFAKLNLFDGKDYQQIVSRIYLVLGVIMLFVLAYSLLKAVINPDDFAKGETSFPNLIKNIVISLIIITVLPTIFSFVFNIQNAILNQDTIPKLILDDDMAGVNYDGTARLGDYNSEVVRDNGGNTIAYWTFRAFFYPNPEYCSEDTKATDDTEATEAKYKTISTMECADTIKYNTSINPSSWFNRTTLKETYENIYNNRDSSFTDFVAFSKAVDDDEINYIPIISTIVGALLFLILLTYCISLALRSIKLAFYQIIAPIPVIMRVMPGDKKKVFDNWVKQIIGTFVDVFIRIAILYLGVYLIQLIISKFGIGALNGTSFGKLGYVQQLFAMAFLIVGVLMFVRSAPGMLKDLFGFDVGGSLNPFKIFQDAAGASAIAASPLVGGLQGLRNYKQARSEGKNLKDSLKSGIGGAGSAAARMAWASRNTKSWSDAKNAATGSLKAATEAKKYRAEYARKHPNENIAMAHFNDFKDWLTGKSVEEYDSRIKAANNINTANDNFRKALEDQWEKHNTDAKLIFDMEESDFKGEGSHEMYELFKAYKAAGASASTIRQNIESRRTSHQKTDYKALAKEELGEFDDDIRSFTDEQQKELRDRCNKVDENGNSYWDTEEEKKFIAELRKKHEESIQQLALKKSIEKDKEMAYLDSMYKQMKKFSITSLGEYALRANPADRQIGTIKSSDLFDANQLGELLSETISSSGLTSRDASGKVVIMDPAKYDPEHPEEAQVILGDGGLAKSMDDMASAAQNISSDASREKQKYLEKKTDNH